MFNDVPDVLRIKDVVSLLQMSESTVKRLMKSGRLPYTKIGRLVYIKKESLIDLISAKEVAKPSEKAYYPNSSLMNRVSLLEAASDE